MVFCYKIITETPNWSYNTSPRRKSRSEKRLLDSSIFLTEIPKAAKNLNFEEAFNEIPEREWRLLDALAKKRDEERERRGLADHFQKLWLKEKEDREKAEAEIAEKYQRYLQDKRQFESYLYRDRQMQNMSRQNYKKKLIEETIRTKEERSRDLLEWINGAKNNNLIEKSIDCTARTYLAQDRKDRQIEADKYRHELEFLDTKSRLDKARIKRNDNLRDASKRIAIHNALASWGSTINKQEQNAHDMAKRAAYAYNAALTEERSKKMERAREARLQHSRRVAQITRMLRDVVRNGRF